MNRTSVREWRPHTQLGNPEKEGRINLWTLMKIRNFWK